MIVPFKELHKEIFKNIKLGPRISKLVNKNPQFGFLKNLPILNFNSTTPVYLEITLDFKFKVFNAQGYFAMCGYKGTLFNLDDSVFMDINVPSMGGYIHYRNSENHYQYQYWSKCKVDPALVISPTRMNMRLANSPGINSFLKSCDVPDDDVAKFYEFAEMQASIKSASKWEKYISIVKGEDIRYIFHYANTAPRGSIGKSCMRYEKCQKYFDFYVENPEISFLIYKVGNIVNGRCIIYNGEYYGRIYFNSRAIETEIKTYLLANNYRQLNLKKIQLSKSLFNFYPYVDSLQYLNIQTNTLESEKTDDRYQIRISSTGGEFTSASVRKISAGVGEAMVSFYDDTIEIFPFTKKDVFINFSQLIPEYAC